MQVRHEALRKRQDNVYYSTSGLRCTKTTFARLFSNHYQERQHQQKGLVRFVKLNFAFQDLVKISRRERFHKHKYVGGHE